MLINIKDGTKKHTKKYLKNSVSISFFFNYSYLVKGFFNPFKLD